MPIAISVKDGYRFWAIDLKEKIGSVVCGYEPEFEDVEIVAEDFEQFLLDVMKNNI
ncbi:MAG: hypothetical protein IJZ47_04620 [Oscillospiraceae bacterium]|nr:hypothetical protein [Oscillospiraceae bacterium]